MRSAANQIIYRHDLLEAFEIFIKTALVSRTTSKEFLLSDWLKAVDLCIDYQV